jgi:hypothetical protein
MVRRDGGGPIRLRAHAGGYSIRQVERHFAVSGQTLFDRVEERNVLMFGIVLVRRHGVIVGDMGILSVDRSRVSNYGLREPLDAVLIDARSLLFGPLHWVDLDPIRREGEIDLITLTVSFDGANDRLPESIGDLM